MTRDSEASSSGPPTSMMTPSSTDPRSRMIDTTTKLTTAPASRAVTSKTLPIRQKSLAKLVTTSPAGISRVRAGPARRTDRSVTRAVRNDEMSQLRTANQCRPLVVTALTRPRPMIAADQATRAPASWATSPSSMALPIAAGTRAIESIHGTPKSTPPRRVRHCRRASQRSRRSASCGGAASASVA